MAEINRTSNSFKGQVLSIVAIILSVVAIVLSIIPNQTWDFNNGNNPMDGNNHFGPGFGQRFPRNNQNWQNNDNTKNPYTQRDNKDFNRNPKANIDNNGTNNNTYNDFNRNQPGFPRMDTDIR